MTVDMYIWQQEEGVRSVLDYLHQLIVHLAPEARAAIKWNLPYYTLNQGLLYLHVKARAGGTVEICFTRGQKFIFGKELLSFKNRKLVGGYTVNSLASVDEEALVQLIAEAIRLDQEHSTTSPWKK